MSTEVFWGSGSTPAWRVLLAFAVKGMPYESRLLSFSAKEQRQPEFLAINPRGKVPAIRDGDFCLNESLAIMAWLDATQADPPLFGRDAEEVGLSWAFTMEYLSHGSPAFDALARPLLFGSPPEPGSLAEARQPVVDELERLAQRVDGPFDPGLVGDFIGTADIVWYCALRFLERALTRPCAADHALDLWPIIDHFPSLGPWAERIEAVEGFAATVPPHWLTSDPPTQVNLR